MPADMIPPRDVGGVRCCGARAADGDGMKKPYERFTAIICFAGAALVGYWAWRYEGLYRWLAEWQLRHGGGFEEQNKFILALAIVLPPHLIVGGVWGEAGP